MSTKNYSYSYSNETFSGCDMVATILIPDSVTGQKLPYTIGELQTISYSIHQDRQPVRSIGNINVKDYVMGPRTIAGSLVFAVFNKHFAKKIMSDINNKISPGYSFMIDEVPPFDIVISAANEYGLRSRMAIYGVRLVNEGQVMSINDIYTENTYQFVATDLEYLTDENSYQSSIVNHKTVYRITNGSQPADIIKPNRKPGPSKIETKFTIDLNYKVRKKSSKYGLGLVDLWLTPARRTGTLTIFNDSYSATINVANSISENNIISVHLPTGLYTAHWDNAPSNESASVKFAIVEAIEEPIERMPAPLIEFINDNRIIVKSNYRKHTRVIYTNQNDESFTVNLIGGKATIKNLDPESTYTIATCNTDLNIKSDAVKVTTLSNGYDMFYDLLDFLKYNKKALRYEDFDKYIQVVTEARDLYFSGTAYESIVNCFVDVKNNNTAILNSLEQVNFPGLIEYQEEVNRLTALINIAEELATISSSLQTDKVYGYNYDTMVVAPPKVIRATDGMATLLVDSTIDSIDFYRQFTKTTQFSSNIKKRNFEEVEEGFLCKFNGRPNTKHYAYAINSFGFKSPRVDFFSLENNAQIIANEKAQEQSEAIAYALEKARYNYGASIPNSLTSEEEKKVLIEAIKDEVKATVAAPQILKTSDRDITLIIDEDNKTLEDNNYKIVISNLEDSLITTAKYKIPASATAQFTIEDHGLRPNEHYVMWIEDEDENQVSKCVTAYTAESSEIDDTKQKDLNKFVINNIIDDIKKQLKENKLDSNVMNLILNTQQDNSENNKSNLIMNLLRNVMSEHQNISNVTEIIYLLFSYYLNNRYEIDEDFFNITPLLNKNTNTLEIYEDCLAYRFDLKLDNIEQSIIKINAGDSINTSSSSLYSIICFSDNFLKHRSGFIFINNLTKECKTYKMTVKAGA